MHWRVRLIGDLMIESKQKQIDVSEHSRSAVPNLFQLTDPQYKEVKLTYPSYEDL
jgi:hypothetical protein